MTVATKPAPPACIQPDDALRESQRFLRASLDALPGHIAVLDDAGVILEINAAWRRFADENKFASVNYGVGSSYLLYCDQIFSQAINPKICHQTCAQTCAAGISAVISGEQDLFEMEYPFRSPTEERWFVMRVTRFQSPGPTRIVIVHDDCTERKRAEIILRESESFCRSIISSSPDCIKVLDLDGNLLSMLSGQALLGIEDIRPFLNKSWLNFWSGEDRVLAQRALASAAAGITGSTSNFVGFLRTTPGKPRWWDVAVSPILGADGKPERLLMVSRDVTQRKQAEMNLAFLAAVSHDLVRWDSIDEMMQIVGAKLAAHFGLSICAFVQIDEKAEQVVIDHDWHRDDVPSLIGTHHLADFVGDEFIRMARTGEAIVVRDTAADARTADAKFTAFKIASFICMPLIYDAQWRFALCLYHSAAYDWRDDEIELARELTARIWTRLERLRAEATLFGNEWRLRNAMDSARLTFVEVDLESGGAWTADNFAAVMGYASPPEEEADVSVGIRLLLEHVVPHDRLRVQAALNEFISGKPVGKIDYQVRGDDEIERWIESRWSIVRGADGQPLKSFATNLDVTERKLAEQALRESEQRYRNLFNSMDEGFSVIDMIFDEQQNPVDFLYLDINPAFEKLTGMQGVVGKRIRDIVPDLEARWFDLYGKVALTGEPVRYTNEVKQLNRWFDVFAFRLGGPESRKVAVLFTNITERTLLENKTKEQASTLADLNRRKDEFIAMLSHELRNPLAPITNAVQLLRLQQSENPIQQQARGIIERQVGQLTRLIDDLMEVSRLTSGRINLHEELLSLSTIVEHATETVRPLINQQRHLLDLSLPPAPIWLFADAARLEQVLVNLLTNAAKYTDKGGVILLSIAQEDDEAVIRVRDTGVGISAELLPRVFDLFTQAEQALDRSQGGLGIGLCLVQRLVEMHGGTVVVHSTLGQGSEFIVRLPVVKNSALSSIAANAPTLTHEASLRVLVVDDSVDTAATLSALLELTGHTVRIAHDGVAALAAAADFQPDVVLLDIGLPGINGFEVAKQLRATHENMALVAMTGYGEASARQRSREAGFNHHLVKPASFEQVQAILASVTPGAVSKPMPKSALN